MISKKVVEEIQLTNVKVAPIGVVLAAIHRQLNGDHASSIHLMYWDDTSGYDHVYLQMNKFGKLRSKNILIIHSIIINEGGPFDSRVSARRFAALECPIDGSTDPTHSM